MPEAETKLASRENELAPALDGRELVLEEELAQVKQSRDLYRMGFYVVLLGALYFGKLMLDQSQLPWHVVSMFGAIAATCGYLFYIVLATICGKLVKMKK